MLGKFGIVELLWRGKTNIYMLFSILESDLFCQIKLGGLMKIEIYLKINKFMKLEQDVLWLIFFICYLSL